MGIKIRPQHAPIAAPPSSAALPPGEDVRGVPIFVIVRDRVSSLQNLVDRLERAGQQQIVLVDNSSTYPPLLEYLSTTSHRVVRTGRNDGPSSPWTSGCVAATTGRFVVTDPDIWPDDSCPDDFMHVLYESLDALAAAGVKKVGMGLRVDDLPPTSIGESVRAWELPRFWQRTVGNGRRGEIWYDAFVDTTFAIYLPGAIYDAGCARAARLGPPYLMRCGPWYEEPATISDEERYYCERASTASNQAAHMRRLLDELPR